MTNPGKNYNFGDVILSKVQYTDTFETKIRPGVVLFEDYGNVVCAAITSNPNMKGINLTKKEGAIKDSVIKLNYIFTVSEDMISKKLFYLTENKKEEIKKALISLLK